MTDSRKTKSRFRLKDRTRLMVFSIAILTLTSLSAVAVTAFHLGNWSQSTLLAAIETLVLVIAGGTLLVRVCNPFIRRLEESEARTRAIVSTAGDGIITMDPQGVVRSCNKAALRMFDCAEDRILGRDIDKLIALPSGFCFAKEQLTGRHEVYHRGHKAWGFRSHHAKFPIEFSLGRVPLGQSELFTVIVRDTTEREAAHEQLRSQMFKLQEVKESLEIKAAELAKTNRELDDFTYVASHDLKEPLRGISSYCQILAEDYSDKLDADGARRLGSLSGLCQRLSRLIDDLLNYSQIGRKPHEPEAVDLNEIVVDALETLRPMIDERGGVVHVLGRLPKIMAEPVLIGEVFRNLITNALKFNESEEPTVEVGCLAGNTLYVRDNGIGIPDCHHESIFVMFRRLHSRQKFDGTGAGLALVRKIVEAHGGRVWVRSQPGSGSTFYFTLSGSTPHVRQERQELADCVAG